MKRFGLLLWLLCGAVLAAPLEWTAAELLPLAQAHGGLVRLLEPPPAVLKVDSGALLVFSPSSADPALTLTLPVPDTGHYRIITHYVYGPWRAGSYGKYDAFADGVALNARPNTYIGGWTGGTMTPPYRMTAVNWGAVGLSAPDVRLTFRLDTTAPGSLLAIEKVRLEPVALAAVPAAERRMQVPEPPFPEAPSWPPCEITRQEALTWVTPVTAPRAPVTVDGNPGEWDFTSPAFTIGAATGGRGYGAPAPAGDADMSQLVQVAWDETTLYLAARVRDDMRAETAPGAAWSSFWSHDGLVLLLHLPPWTAPAARTLTVGFNYYSPGSTPRDLPGGVRYAALPAKDGYTLEAAVPFAALGYTPRAGDRLSCMLIAVDIDPRKKAGQQFAQYLWNTRGEDPGRWGELRLMHGKGWAATLTPERTTLAPGAVLRYVGVADVLKPGLVLKAVEVVARGSGEVVLSRALDLPLPAQRRLHLRGDLPLPADLPVGEYDVRAWVE
jgi:hypothetical protein